MGMHPIARYRKARGWTQAALAQRVGVSTNTVQAWEKGAEPRPTLRPKLAEVLGVDSLQLLIEVEDWQAASSERTRQADRASR